MFGSATTYPRTRQEVRDKSEVFLFYWRPILVSLSKFWILIFPHIFGHRRCRNGIGAEDIFDSWLVYTIIYLYIYNIYIYICWCPITSTIWKVPKVRDPITSLAITVPYFWAREQHHQLIPLKSVNHWWNPSIFPITWHIYHQYTPVMLALIYQYHGSVMGNWRYTSFSLTNLGLFIYFYSSKHHPILNGYRVWLQSKPPEILERFEYPTIKLPNCWLTYPNIYLVTSKIPPTGIVLACFSHFPICSARISQIFHTTLQKILRTTS